MAPWSEAETQRAPMLVIGEPVTGMVLAGGPSRRMHADKAWMPIAGRPMIRWVIDALREVTDELIVVARDVQPFGNLGATVVQDRMPMRGPLTGIHAGLKATETDLNLVVACDLPLVQPPLLALLARAVGATHGAVPYAPMGAPPPRHEPVTGREAGLQPLCAAYRRACIAPLEKLLLSGQVPSVALISVVKARIVGPETWREYDPEGHSFFNVNTPEDRIAAERILIGASGDED
jgi:molybdopterin-guanine dinucleotide biosynthesis protein A